MASVRVFIVEVWTPDADQAAFRGSVRAVEEEVRQVFDDLDRLGRFLAGEAAASDTGPGAPHSAGSTPVIAVASPAPQIADDELPESRRRTAPPAGRQCEYGVAPGS